MFSVKRVDDPSGIVSKFIFESDNAIAEAVVYRYNDRGVICFSVQSGCPVGCVFCGTGKRFIRNLTKDEMIFQIETCLPLIEGKDRIQLMAMSMGEPLYNFDNIPIAEYLQKGYYVFLSSVGLLSFDYTKVISLAAVFDKFGFQISLHDWDQTRRIEKLGSHKNLLPIQKLTDLSKEYLLRSGHLMYFNYIATGRETEDDVHELLHIVRFGHITVSVLCPNEFSKGDPGPAKRLSCMILDVNPNQSMKLFDPMGQDTIGGGCGQLLYVQERLKAINIVK